MVLSHHETGTKESERAHTHLSDPQFECLPLQPARRSWGEPGPGDRLQERIASRVLLATKDVTMKEADLNLQTHDHQKTKKRVERIQKMTLGKDSCHPWNAAAPGQPRVLLHPLSHSHLRQRERPLFCAWS